MFLWRVNFKPFLFSTHHIPLFDANFESYIVLNQMKLNQWMNEWMIIAKFYWILLYCIVSVPASPRKWFTKRQLSIRNGSKGIAHGEYLCRKLNDSSRCISRCESKIRCCVLILTSIIISGSGCRNYCCACYMCLCKIHTTIYHHHHRPFNSRLIDSFGFCSFLYSSLISTKCCSNATHCVNFFVAIVVVAAAAIAALFFILLIWWCLRFYQFHFFFFSI